MDSHGGDGSSDSGVSVTERSVSRSSVLSDDRSSSVEIKANTPTPQLQPQRAPLVAERRLCLDPAAIVPPQSDPAVRHIQSLQQHMSQHYPGGLPPAPAGMPASSHAPHLPGAVSMPPDLPPAMAYPGSHLNMLPLATMYQQHQDMWKLGAVPGLPSHVYPPNMLRSQDDVLRMEHLGRERRMYREQRDTEAREKQAKMEKDRREKKERDRREREELQREQEKERQRELERQKVNEHFQDSFRLASQKKVPGWNHSERDMLLEKRDDERGDMYEHDAQIYMTEKIKYLFHNDTHQDAQSSKRHTSPPPAHSGLVMGNDKVTLSSIPKMQDGYPVCAPSSRSKDLKSHHVDRMHYGAHEKASVIVTPDLKGEKLHPLAVSPKPRVGERSSPFQPAIGTYKSFDPALMQHRKSVHHSPVELTKARPAQPSPHGSTASHTAGPSPHIERYFAHAPKSVPHTPLNSSGMLSNSVQMTAIPSKPKVTSPQQVYGKPTIVTGSSMMRVDSRSNQPMQLSNKSVANEPPPPAHLSNRLDTRHVIPHDRDRPAYDVRIHQQPSHNAHHKPSSVVAPPTVPTRLTPVSSIQPLPPHVTQPSSHPTQTQPLDLGTREDACSPSKRCSITPALQEPKKARLETSSTQQPMLSRVSEPCPLYPSAATTITTVENLAALDNLPKVSSPCRPPSHPPASCTPSAVVKSERTTSPSVSKATSEPEKVSSPVPMVGYVHKLKRAALQRQDVSTESASSPPGTSTAPPRVSTPPSLPLAGNSKSQLLTSCTASPNNSSSNSTPSRVDPRGQKKLPSLHNGHSQDSKDIANDSTSSDSEDSNSHDSSKRSRVSRNIKVGKKNSDTNSESGKESDSSESSVKKATRTLSRQEVEPKKRGRKPKVRPQYKDEDQPRSKKTKLDAPLNNPLQKPPVTQLKKTGESFLQNGDCSEVAPRLPKCRECRMTSQHRNKKKSNEFCRFYAFRRLRYTKNGSLAVAGFSDPHKDVYKEDLRLWVPDVQDLPADLDLETSKFLLEYVGDQFCDLVQQESEAMALHMGDDSVVAWKRVVQGVREMCDVCETTLFNIHWACSKCGFVVCIDCYKGRKNGTIKIWGVAGGKDRDEYSWLVCTTKVPHELDKLMLTQIIASNALYDLGKKVHEIRHLYDIPQYCNCAEAKRLQEEGLSSDARKVNGIVKDFMKGAKKEKPDLVNGTVKQEKEGNEKDDDSSSSPLSFFANVALSNNRRESEGSDTDSDSDSKEAKFSTLRELLVRPNSKSGGDKEENRKESKKKGKVESLDEVISSVLEQNENEIPDSSSKSMELKHFVRKYNYARRGREPLPVRIMTKTESSSLYPNVPHSWLCSGKLLRLLDPLCPDNIKPFQEQWKRGQPVIVSGVGTKLNMEMWKPQSFIRDFGDVKNDFINCLTGNIVPNQPMRKFWEGFENYAKRLKDEKGQPMLLKLKDWPPSDDFAEMLPDRFEDLMKHLAMREYTQRNGRLNLASRLPECFVRPDLGPKMYTAYGCYVHPNKASTNLHLDVSDAANVMCYVSSSKDLDQNEEVKDVLKAIDEARCDVLTINRVREEDTPGALWHIYHARDADKIRDLLNKVAIERGTKLEPHHDPIHDQSWYLCRLLRERLYKEYGVEGYAIVQCVGDSVFVPAGAPHQVRNLHNCIKVAEDFVSPENIMQCFHLTQEFRHLSDTHTNHEDKLQIKNIIYHAMKDSVACLMAVSKQASSSSSSSASSDAKIKDEPDTS